MGIDRRSPPTGSTLKATLLGHYLPMMRLQIYILNGDICGAAALISGVVAVTETVNIHPSFTYTYLYITCRGKYDGGESWRGGNETQPMHLSRIGGVVCSCRVAISIGYTWTNIHLHITVDGEDLEQ